MTRRSKIYLKNIKRHVKFTLEGLFFSSAIENIREKIFVTTNGLIYVKFSLINGKLYQTIGEISLNEIKNWNEIKKSPRWVNVNSQAQSDNRDSKHFSENFIPKNIGDMLYCMLKIIDGENKERNI